MSAPVLDLSDNTNCYGAPPSALRALGIVATVLKDSSMLGGDDVTRYPSATADALRAALARMHGTTSDRITTGCGSDGVLDAAVRTLVAPGATLAHPDPTFSMIPELVSRNRLVAAPVPLAGDGDIRADLLLATGAAAIYVASPNNPTGTPASRAAIARLAASGETLILDQAYADFTSDASLDLALARPNVLVTRTLSKAFGLAGLRVGYAIGDPALIARIEAARDPYAVSAVAERAACAVIERDLTWVRERAAEAVRDRARLAAALTACGFAPLRSEANFVLVPVRDALACAGRMRERGVMVRAFPALTGIGDAVRITVAPSPALERAVAALAEAAR
ncbi:MAG: histidinol-phosphate aminotransferase family protein [Candidatus Eisenbacteria bacterium]|nr:histidinol-phosphate aminotransferase family protein [Candidatus Eisenbacteria bacterium]